MGCLFWFLGLIVWRFGFVIVVWVVFRFGCVYMWLVVDECWDGFEWFGCRRILRVRDGLSGVWL